MRFVAYGGAVLHPNPHTIVVMENSTEVSFSDAYARLESMGWSPGDGSAELMLIVGSQHACGNFTAEFRNLEIY